MTNTGEIILQNMQCLSQAPNQTTLQCTAYAKESDPTSSATVYLQNDLMCTLPPPPHSMKKTTDSQSEAPARG